MKAIRSLRFTTRTVLGKDLKKKCFDKRFSVQKFYTIFDLFTEPYQWRRHYADLAKKTRGVTVSYPFVGPRAWR